MKSPTNNHDPELQKAEHIAFLIAGHIRGSLAPSEQEELDAWIVESDENLELFEKLTDEDNIEIAMQSYMEEERRKAAALAGVKRSLELDKRSRLHKIWPYLIAASIITILFSIYLFNLNDKPVKPGDQHLTKIPVVEREISPGSDKAVLTLSDGRTIILDSFSLGLLAEDKGALVENKEGSELIYNNATTTEIAFHTLSIPRGGQYRVSLPDGTKVWLNAESSLRFPIAFNGIERKVELKGEGYFEVKKDVSKPFVVIVQTPGGDGSRVTVLGTRFNINAYADEGNTRATLVEGSVLIEKGKTSRILKPGEQALINDTIKILRADVNEETAWKNGKFLFRDATVRFIGEQLKRWYDVDVEYEGHVPQHFNLEVSREVSLSRLLEGLEGTKEVQFTLQGKKLIIKPSKASK